MSKQTVPALDYITMNRNTARKGIITPKEIRKYRKENPARVKEGEHSMYRSDADPNGINCVYTRAKAKLPSDSNPQFTYGKPTRLMTDHYQRQWAETVAEENKIKEQAAKERHMKKKSAKQHARHFVAVPKHKFISEKDTKELFKMTKFKKIPATVVSHREAKHEHPAALMNFVELNIKTADGKAKIPNSNEAPEQEIDPSLLMRLKQFEFEAVDAAQKEDYNKALEFLDSAIALHSTYASAFNNRAQVYRILGETDKALQDIKVAIKYGGPATLKQAYTQRAVIHKNAGEEAEAEKDFAKGAQYGNEIAQAMVKNNPYAKLCNQMVSEAMAKLAKDKTK
ncbi:Tetratricopeptide repeat protein 36 [Terramyces sp. JEL0728]|nr:Tetratricopeptide repeat protein 36 [Terramyces sp. JEL0728]